MGCWSTVARAPSGDRGGNEPAPLGFDHVDSAREAGRAHVEDDGAPTLPTLRPRRPGAAVVCTVVRPGWVATAPPGGSDSDRSRGSTERHMPSDSGTKTTSDEAPAEAATDTPTGSPRQPQPTLPEGFGELDRRAIDTARVLAMDAVQKVGN